MMEKKEDFDTIRVNLIQPEIIHAEVVSYPRTNIDKEAFKSNDFLTMFLFIGIQK
jgi:hypothetical protein